MIISPFQSLYITSAVGTVSAIDILQLQNAKTELRTFHKFGNCIRLASRMNVVRNECVINNQDLLFAGMVVRTLATVCVFGLALGLQPMSLLVFIYSGFADGSPERYPRTWHSSVSAMFTQ